MKLSDYLNFNLSEDTPRHETLSKLFNIPIPRIEELLKEIEREMTLAKIDLASKIALGSIKGDKDISISKFIFLQAVTNVNCLSIEELLLVTEIATTESMYLLTRLQTMNSDNIDPAIINKLVSTIHES